MERARTYTVAEQQQRNVSRVLSLSRNVPTHTPTRRRTTKTPVTRFELSAFSSLVVAGAVSPSLSIVRHGACATLHGATRAPIKQEQAQFRLAHL